MIMFLGPPSRVSMEKVPPLDASEGLRYSRR
jgi:hypothetical protein